MNPYRLLPLMLLLLLTAACTPALFDPPRRATQVALQDAPAMAAAIPYVSEAPTATAAAIDAAVAATEAAETNPSITIWINEVSSGHAEVMDQMAAEFNRQHNIHVEVILVAPRLLPDLIRTAAISNTLPDLVLHPIEYTMGWTERGILDAGAATEVVNRLGRTTFDPDTLELVTVSGSTDSAGLPSVAAVPIDGWKQLLIYRADWFEQRGLAPPTQFDQMLTAAAAFYEPDSLISGLVIPTESALVSTQQVFEQIAVANGCRLIDNKGEVTLLHPACLAALDFYRAIVNQYSPSDVQTDNSALNAYLAGRTGMIVTSPRVLPQLAGLDASRPPTCPECGETDYLVRNSGFITEIRGSGDFATTAGFSEINYLGITRSANKEAAADFMAYWLSDGYLAWLAVTPDHKVPMRWGTAVQPTQFLDAWGDLPLATDGPSIKEVYGEELVSRLSQGVGSAQRWGFAEDQGILMTRLYENLTLSIVLQEMLSGYFSSSQAIIEAHKRVVALIPNYIYSIEIEAEN